MPCAFVCMWMSLGMYMRTLYFSACVCAHACMLGAPGHTRADKAPYPLQHVPRLARDSTRVLGVIIRWTPGRPEEGETQHPALSLPPGRRPVNTCQAQASCTHPTGELGGRACVQPADSCYLLFYQKCFCIQLCSLGSQGFVISLRVFKMEMCF